MAHLEHINGEGLIENISILSSINLTNNNIYCLEIISELEDFEDNDEIILALGSIDSNEQWINKQILYQGSIKNLKNNNIISFLPSANYDDSSNFYINNTLLDSSYYILSEVNNILDDKQKIHNINIEGIGNYSFIINEQFFNLDSSLQLIFSDIEIYFFAIYHLSTEPDDYLIIDYWT